MIAADPVHWDVAADALIRAVVFDGLRLDHPAVSMLLNALAPVAEAEVLERIKHDRGDTLRNLVAAGAVRPADVLPVGLAVLSALAQLCRSDSASVLQ